jgi:hypothetical protein
MRFRAPLVAAAFLGGAVTLVWLDRDEPRSTVSEAVSLPPPAAKPVAVADSEATSEEARPSLPPAPQQRPTDPATTAVADPPRSPLPGEALTTPLIQLIEDQRAFRTQPPPAGVAQELTGVRPQIAEVELAFAAEPIDVSWAAGAEANVLGKIAQINGLELVDLRVECRSTQCRVQLTQPVWRGTTPPTDVIGATGLEPHWVLSLLGRGGSLDTVAYLWREGFAPARPNHEEAPQ